MLTNGLYNFSNIVVHNDLSSDHPPVTFSVDAQGVEFISKQLIPSYKRADWMKFKRVLQDCHKVRQSPTLYGVFTCDCDPPELPNGDLLAVFADDTAINTSHSDVSIVVQCLQNAVNLLQLYYSSWKIKINPSKSQCIYFS
jgi:hypothetical protein